MAKLAVESPVEVEINPLGLRKARVIPEPVGSLTEISEEEVRDKTPVFENVPVALRTNPVPAVKPMLVLAEEVEAKSDRLLAISKAPERDVKYPASFVKNPTLDGIVKVSCPEEVEIVHRPTAVEVVKVKVGPDTPFMVVVEPDEPQVVVANVPEAFTVTHDVPAEPSLGI